MVVVLKREEIHLGLKFGFSLSLFYSCDQKSYNQSYDIREGEKEEEKEEGEKATKRVRE